MRLNKRRCTLWLAVAVMSLGCKDKADAEDILTCGEQECPPGTYFDEERIFESGVNVSVGVTPTKGSANGKFGYASFKNGECSFTCVAVAECPDDTWPVITDECFTCAAFNDDGDIVAHNCSD